MTVFDIRLGPTVLDALDSADSLAPHRIAEDLHRWTTNAKDGYSARENLAHPLFTALATDRQAQDCRALLGACALGAGALPDQLRGEPKAALRASEAVIREALPRCSFDPGRLSPLESLREVRTWSSSRCWSCSPPACPWGRDQRCGVATAGSGRRLPREPERWSAVLRCGPVLRGLVHWAPAVP